MRIEYDMKDPSEERRHKSSQLSGLAMIESLYFRAGAEVAQGQLRRLFGGEESRRTYAFCDRGQPAIGLNTLPSDDIDYETFSAPISWNAVYSVQKIRLGPKAKSDYLFHPGEEIVIPTSGAVAFHFFWSPGASRPDRVVLNPAASKGEILRINPQIPHHAWAADGEASAWLILRDAMNSPVALVVDRDSISPFQKRLSIVSERSTDAKALGRTRSTRQRRVTATDLRKPGAYAMIAWGISELIRDARLKAGLSPTDLAREVGVDPSSISRLEEAKANVSVEMLAKVCSALRIGMTDCMQSGSWIYGRNLVDCDWKSGQSSKVPGDHCLHVNVLKLEKGSFQVSPTAPNKDSFQFSSWIVLTGKVMAELPNNMEAKSMILDTDNVIHFREYGEIALHALQDSTIAQIVYSPTCVCPSK